MLKNKGLAVDDREERIALLKTNHFRDTRFNFINKHHGLKPGQKHVLLGTSGTGKSTLSRSLLIDLAYSHNILFYSSEESIEETKNMMALRGASNEALKNIEFVHEDELLKECKSNLNVDEWRRIMAIRLMNCDAEIFFFDNITTSDFYDGVSIPSAKSFVLAIDSLIKEFNIPILIVAHTKTGIKDDQQTLIGPDDIRGPKSLTNKCQFLYVYQRINFTDIMGLPQSFGFIRVIKGRGLSNVNSIYMLVYNSERREYMGDDEISFEKFNNFYKTRNKLGSK